MYFEQAYNELRQTLEQNKANLENPPQIVRDIILGKIRSLYEEAMDGPLTIGDVEMPTPEVVEEKEVKEDLQAKVSNGDNNIFAQEEKPVEVIETAAPLMQAFEGNGDNDLFAESIDEGAVRDEDEASTDMEKKEAEERRREDKDEEIVPIVEDEQHEASMAVEEVDAAGVDDEDEGMPASENDTHTSEEESLNTFDESGYKQSESTEKVEEESKPYQDTLKSDEAGKKESAQAPHELSLFDMLSKSADNKQPVSVGDKFEQGQRNVGDVISEQVASHKVTDLRTIININDKFSFVGALFHNNMRAYTDFILRLNAIERREEAVAYISEVAQQYNWNMDSIEVKTFNKIFDRKF